MPSRFLNNININDEYSLPNADGSADQIITTDGAGQLSFVDQSTISAGNAEHVVIYAKNTSGASISKGTPVYITGTVGATDTVQIAPADAGNSAKMPAVGLLDDTLANNAFGYVITGGFMDNITTDPIDGATPSSNDTVYVKAGGGLTLTKPTGSNLIQNVAKVGKVSGGNSGSLIVSSILRTNDVPNLTTGKIWVGSAANTIESATVHLDETNERMGIGTTSPFGKLHVDSGSSGQTSVSSSASDLVLENSSNSGITILSPSTTSGNIFFGDESDFFIGGIRYYHTNDSLLFYTNNSEWVRINSSGNVGIGTTSPSTKLDVNGITTGRGFRTYQANTNYSLISRDSAGNAPLYVQSANASTNQNIARFNYGSANANQGQNVLTVAKDNSYFVNTNVGIGTTSPGQKLHVDGSIRVGDTNDVVYADKFFTVSNANLHIGTNNGYDTVFFNGPADERMRITSTGNVGIGTTSPGQNLEISTQGNAAIRLTSTNSTTSTLQFADSDDGNVGMIQYNHTTNSLIFRTNDGERMHITSAGKVGIGTNNPLKKLHISTSDDVVALFQSTDSVSKIEFADNNTTGSVRPSIGASGNNTIFTHGATERMRIDSSGNVGIGTTIPRTKLHISGITGDDDPSLGASTAPFFVSNTANSYGLNIGVNNLGDAWLQAQSNTSAIAYDILLNPLGGNVGIGTTSPGRKLDIEGGGFSMFADGGTSADLFSVVTHQYTFSDENEDAVYSYNGTDGHEFSTGGTPRVNIKQNGNVGIGTTNPQRKFHVNGITRIEANAQTLDLVGTDHTFIGFYPDGAAAGRKAYIGFPGAASDRLTIANEFNDDISFFTNGSEKVTIENSGDVGIGTTSPSYKLDLRGDLRVDNGDLGGTSGDEVTHAKIHGQRHFLEFKEVRTANGTDWKDTTYKLQAGVDATDHQSIDFVADGSYQEHIDIRTGNQLFHSRFDSSGRLGIGTTSPTSKIHVAQAQNNNFSTAIAWTASANDVLNITNDNSTDTNNYASLYMRANGSSGAFSSRIVARNTTAGTGELHFQLRDSAHTANTETKLMIDSGGNVGIGTSSPAQKLDVAGDATFDGRIYTNATALASVGILGKAIANGWAARYDSNDANYSGFYFDTNNHSNIIGRVAGGTITNWIAASGDSYLNGGNVGIGTTSPSPIGTNVTTLDIQGSSGGGLRFGTTAGVESTFYTFNNAAYAGSISSIPFHLSTANSIRATILANGNFGIGTSQPGAKLDIFNTGASSGSLADCQTYSALTIKPYSSVDSKLTFSANGVSTQLIQATNNSSTTGRQISLQPFSGNVGVGVILPSEKLDVNGVVKSSQGYKGYVSYFHNAGFFHSPRSQDGANPLWIPINTTGMSSSDQYYNTWVPLYAGRVRKIIIKHISGSTPVATVCTFRKKINGVLSSTTYAGTVTGGGAAGMKVTFDFGISNFTFNAEDEVQIGIVTGVATQPRMGGMSCQIWYEYNIT